MKNNINFLYAIKPFYIHQKLLGLVPFTIDLNNSENLTRKCRWNILYTSFLAVAITCFNTVKFYFDFEDQGNFLFKLSEFLTRILIFTSAIVTLLLNIICGRESFNRVIEKIILVDKHIWHHDLPGIYRKTRSVLIKVILIYIPFELSLIIVDLIWDDDFEIFSEVMFILDIINASIVMQIVLLSWLLIQRFDRIHNLLELYFPQINIQIQQYSDVKTKNR